MLWVNLLMWLMVLCDGLGTWTWDRCNENNGLTFLSSKYHHRFSSVINLGLLPGRMGLYVTWCASQLHQSAHHLNFLWRQHLPLQVLLGSPVMLTYKHTRHAWCHAVINTSTTLSLKGSLCCQLTVLTLLTLVSLEMANEPASPLPLAHVAANSAALLVFDEWNDCFPSPVGYSINGEQQVYNKCTGMLHTPSTSFSRRESQRTPHCGNSCLKCDQWQHHTASWEVLPFTSWTTHTGPG